MTPGQYYRRHGKLAVWIESDLVEMEYRLIESVLALERERLRSLKRMSREYPDFVSDKLGLAERNCKVLSEGLVKT